MFFFSLRTRLLLFALLVTFPILLFFFTADLAHRRRAAEHAKTSALYVARNLASAQNDLIHETRALLSTLALTPQIRTASPDDCPALLQNLLDDAALYSFLGVATSAGELLCSAPQADTPLNVADRAYFQRVLATRAFAVGDYQIGRVTGKTVMAFAAPILDSNDALHSLIIAGADLSWLEQKIDASLLPPATIVTVFDRHGTILSRFPEAGSWIGRSVTDEASIVQTILRQQAEGTAEAIGLDGTPRLYAFTPLFSLADSHAAYVSVGIPTAVAFAQIDQMRTRSLLLFGFLVFCLLSLAWFGSDLLIRRRITTVVQATQRLATGDFSARVAFAEERDEVGQLGQAFDQMAATLQQQTVLYQQAATASRQRAARAEALVRIANRLNAQLDLTTILQIVCEEAVHALNVDGVSLSLYDKKDNHFYHAADVGLPPAYRQRVQSVMQTYVDKLVGQTAAVEADSRDDRRLIIQAVQAAVEDPNAELYAICDIRTIASLGLQRADEVIGRLNLHTFHTPHHFTEEELALLQGLANQAAQAIVNAMLFAETEQHLQQLHTLHTIDKAIIALQELPATLAIIVEQIAGQLAVDAVSILLFDPESQTLAYAAGTGFRSDGRRTHRLRLGEGPAGRAAHTQQIQAVVNLAETQEFLPPPWLAGEAFVSYYGVPLIAKDQLQGVLEIFHRTQLDPESEWLEFLAALALQTAIALDNASLLATTHRLLHQTQTQAQQLAQIMDTMATGMILLDQEQRIVLVNPAAAAYLPQLTDAAVGDVLTHLGELSLTDYLATDYTPASCQEIVLPDPDRVFELRAWAISDKAHPGGWVMAVDDVTAVRERERYLQAQDRLATVGQLAAGIAHDFNNIMAVITTYTHLLQQHPHLEERAVRQLTIIQEQAHHAAALINQILDFSRRSVMSRIPLDLMLFLKEWTKLLERVLPEQITLHLHLRCQEAWVSADVTRLQQAIMNLAVNARDAMSHGGTLNITLARYCSGPDQSAPLPDMPPGDWLQLSITDTGEGIPDAILTHIFEPFFTTKSPDHGTGLGLAQVYGIVKQHEGFIAVSSQVGVGTTFTLYLPAVSPHQNPAPAPSADLARGKGETILLVEDNSATRKAVCEMLEALNYQVQIAANGQEALAFISEHHNRVDLVLSDLIMPEMNGDQLHSALQAVAPQVKMMLMSGYPLEAAGRSQLEQGIRAWIAKPFSAAELSTRLRQVLAP